LCNISTTSTSRSTIAAVFHHALVASNTDQMAVTVDIVIAIVIATMVDRNTLGNGKRRPATRVVCGSIAIRLRTEISSSISTSTCISIGLVITVILVGGYFVRNNLRKSQEHSSSVVIVIFPVIVIVLFLGFLLLVGNGFGFQFGFQFQFLGRRIFFPYCVFAIDIAVDIAVDIASIVILVRRHKSCRRDGHHGGRKRGGRQLLLDFLFLLEANRTHHHGVTVTVAADSKTTTAVAWAASIDTRSSLGNGRKAWRERHDAGGLGVCFGFFIV